MSLIATYLQEIRTKLPAPIERDEWRFTRKGLLQAVKEMTESPMSIISPDLKAKALDSEGRDLKIPVFTIGAVNVTNSRTCTITGYDNTTEMMDVTWTTLVVNIGMKKGEYKKNEVNYLTDLNKKLRLADDAFCNAIETIILAKLEADKSIVYGSPIVTTTYSLVGDAIQVAPAQQALFFNNLDAIMQGDDFYSQPFKILGSTTLLPDVKHYGNQGGANNTNTNYQFDAFDFRFSNQIPDGVGQRATGFCMTDGTLGMLSRINIDSEMGNKSTDGTIWEKARPFPQLGLEVGVQYKSTCGDLSAISGLEHLEASLVEYWQFSIDVAFLTPYNSDPATKAGVIKKFEFNA